MTDPNQPELFPTTTSSHQDILANHFPLRDNEEARKMRETSGDSCLRLSKENTRLGVFSRMFMVTLPWVSTKCLHDMESEGYTTQTFVVPACSLNAPHKRDRLWIVGNSEHDGSLASKIRRGNKETSRGASQGQNQTEQSSRTSRRKDNGSLADTESEGLQGLDKRSPTISTKRDEITDIGTKSSGDKNVSNTHDSRDRTSKHETNQDGQTTEQRREVISQFEFSRHSQDVANSKCMGRESRTSVREELAREESHGKFNNRSTDGSAQERARSWWDVEPNVGRVAYGIPSRVDRLRGLGNAIVPQIAMQIGLSIKEAMNDDYTKKN